MNCYDMMEIPQLQNILRLQGGNNGLANNIRWIYFADCLECIQNEYKIENYIHGGEFVILTNRNVTSDNARIMPLIRQMNEYGISAIGVNEGQISNELKEYCDENNIPLFELPEKYPLVDLSQIMCERLVIEEQNKNSAEQLFASILDAGHLSRENVLAQARYLNINLDGSFSVVEFAFRYVNENTEENSFLTGKKVKRIIKSGLSTLIRDEILILPQVGSILVLVPSKIVNEKEIKDNLERIAVKINNQIKAEVYVGIGNSADYLDDVKRSRNEAAAAIKVAKVAKIHGHILFFNELGIYRIISHVDDVRVLDYYVDENIGRILQADAVGNGNLCETLEKYLNNDCNAQKTAEIMFIHRNTLNYRLRKIKELLGCNLESMDDCLRLKLSFIILNYRKTSRT